MSGSNDDNLLGGCGCLTLIIIAAVIHFQIDIGQLFYTLGNIVKVLLAIGGVVLVLWMLTLIFPDNQSSGYKEKRKEKPKTVYKPDKIIYGHAPGHAPARPIARSEESRVSRLEVPGGYVPFEMTRTQTKTKDSVTTETKIKTYVDSREVKAILKGNDVDFLSDGK